MRHFAVVMGVFVRRLAGLLLIAALWSPTVTAAQGAKGATEADGGEARFLSRVRRLTFDGRRAGEGYFSPDGTRMVFQSERQEGNPFYQIYVLDLETGDTRRVSPGVGKTTCGFIHPRSGEVLFASTHLDPDSARLQREELAARAAGTERRYSWDYDPAMELFVTAGTEPAAEESGELLRLTEARGYDAEASYSPDGQWIVFTSTRQAYERELTAEERERLEVDPSWFGELYRMRADGTRVVRLTAVPGYDGGPFYFPDGSRIVWRRFDERGLTAEIWSARPDGSDARRLTDFGAMSWAPYVHPSGEYILFASNKLGFSNFELYMIDADGTREPVRVTYSEGFDGLPVPTPDGSGLSWTSTRDGGEGGQIYLARWDHSAALAALAAAPKRQLSTH